MMMATDADYDHEIHLNALLNSSTQLVHSAHDHSLSPPEDDESRAHPLLVLDTATIVSISSSCIILISGMVAVICLILYMKKTENYRQHTYQQRNAPSAPASTSHCRKCGSALIIASNNNNNGVTIAANNRIINQSSIEACLEVNDAPPPNLFAQIRPSFAVLRGATTIQESKSQGQPEVNDNLLGFKKLPEIQLKAKVNDANPYLIGSAFDEHKSALSETFSGTIIGESDGDNHFMALNSAAFEPMIARGDASTQQCCHSQCSSNHEELQQIFSQRQAAVARQQLDDSLYGDLSERLSECESRADDSYCSPPDSEIFKIRSFTKSPPEPNERRQGIVFHGPRIKLEQKEQHEPESSSAPDDDSEQSSTSSANSTLTDDLEQLEKERQMKLDEEPHNHLAAFGALPRQRARAPAWMSCMSAQTMRSSSVLVSLDSIEDSFKKGLSESEEEAVEGTKCPGGGAEQEEEGADPLQLKYFKIAQKKFDQKKRNQLEIDC